MHVDATPRHRLVQRRLRQVLDPADLTGADAEQVDRGSGGEAGEQIRTGHPATPSRFVDDDGEPGQLARVAVARIDDAVLDDASRGARRSPRTGR